MSEQPTTTDAPESLALDAVERQQEQWREDARRNHELACDLVTSLQSQLREARARRDKWADKLRELTPRKPRARKAGGDDE